MHKQMSIHFIQICHKKRNFQGPTLSFLIIFSIYHCGILHSCPVCLSPTDNLLAEKTEFHSLLQGAKFLGVDYNDRSLLFIAE